MPLKKDEGFQLYRKDGITYLQAPLLECANLFDHAFSTRIGGCSSGYHATLNTSFHTGDDEKNVLENRRRFFALFNYDYREIVSSNQVHGTDIALTSKADRGQGALPGTTYRHCDALITTEPGLPLAAYSADCMLIYFASDQKPLVALAHAGWRGALGGIAVKVVRFIQDHFALPPESLKTALSPVICRNCYVVDRKVAEQFADGGWDKPAFLESSERGGWHLDLAAINQAQLLGAGIREYNLASVNWCTACRPELFYSYRRDRGVTGRMIGFISIKNTGGGRAV